MKLKIIILFLIICLTKVISRIYQTQLRFSTFRKIDRNWIMLSKLAFQKGQTHIQLKTIVRGIPYSSLQYIQLALIQLENFDTQQPEICHAKHISIHHRIQPNGSETKTSYNLKINEQKTYLIVLQDCEKILSKDYSNHNLFLNINLQVLNNNQHLGAEQKYWYFTIVLFLLSVFFLILLNKKNKCDENYDWIIFIVQLTNFFNVCAIALKLISYILYIKTGVEQNIFDVLFLIFYSLSETFLLCLFMFMSYGWTLNYMNAVNFDLFIPLVTLLSVINVLITTLSKLNDGDFDKDHMYDSIPGIILHYLRFFLTLLDILGLITTYPQIKQPQKKLKQNFFIKFGIFSIYYCSSLIIFTKLTESFVNPIYQKLFLVIIALLNQLTCIGYMVYTMIYSKSYKKICYKNSSPLNLFDQYKPRQKNN